MSALRTARRRAGTAVSLLEHARGARRSASAPGPLVSVVLATYNWSSVLRHSVHSVLWQTHRNLELLVIGDCCTDDSEEVVRSFGDDRVRWLNLAENSGSQSGPNSKGLELARGEYVAYQGHDDVWHPSHLATLVDALEGEREADLAYSLAEVLGPPGSRVRLLSGLSADGKRRIGTWLPPTSVMHRAELGRGLGGWPDWRTTVMPPDVEFLDRAQRAGGRFLQVRALTTFKFPATARPNSYRERPSHEQASYLRRIERQRTFLYRELLALAARRVSPLPSRLPARPGPAADGGPGSQVRYARRVRGLE